MELRFDRGTLLLAGLAPERLPQLPGVLWDARTGSCRAPAHRYAELRASLRRCAEPLADGVGAAALRLGRAPPVALRPYQEAALAAWQIADRRGVVVLPTGSGKTRLAVAAIAASGVAALVLVPTRVLLAQWHAELGRLLGLPVGCYGDGERRLAPLTVATYESAYRHMAEIGHRFDLVVVDEAHHFGNGLRDEALVMSTAAQRLGLTATPPRPGTAFTRLTELVGPVVYQLTLADLTGDYLADFELTTLTLPLNPAERAAYELDMACFRPVCRQFFRANPMATWQDFICLARRSDEGRAALEAWHRARRLLSLTEAKARAVAWLLDHHAAARLLVFTADNEAAYALTRAHLVMPITCDIGRAERAEALAAFRDGRLRALVSAKVLNEGLDVPDADVAIIVGGGQSEREHVQRIGRLLRPAPGKRALVFELVTADTAEVGHAERRRRGLGGAGGADGR